MTVETLAPCGRCGLPLSMDQKICPRCGLLRHYQQLQEFSSQALQLEPTDQWAAIELWKQCLDLLPSSAPQADIIRQRIGMLTGGFAPAPMGYESRVPQPPRAPDHWLKAIAKTTISMLISIAVYSLLFGWAFATGFVLLILVHELGHVAAMRYYGMNAGPPLFIPFVGAVINLRQQPANAWVEAIIGIGGPIAGTVGALVCFAWFVATGSELPLTLAFFGFLLNLFNLLPVPPLDGGRITAAVSPKIWIVGLLLMAAILVHDFFVRERINFILVMILLFAWPRIYATLRGRMHTGDYYNIPRRDSRTIAVMYVLLAILLTGFYIYTGRAIPELL